MDPYEGWTILELMGHRRLAGYVREAEIAGGKFIRIDVPDTEPGGVRATQFYGAAAVYCLTPTTEAVARAIAEREDVAPVKPWELRPAIPQRVTHPDYDDEPELP